MDSNILKVQQGFRILLPFFAGYIAKEMMLEYKDEWWQEVRTVLSDQIRDLPIEGDYATLVDSLDIANCIRLLDRKWNDIFKKKLSIDYRTWAKELMGIRNKMAHIGGEDYRDDDTWRALDTMARLCDAFDDEAAEEIRQIHREALYGSPDGSVQAADILLTEQSKQAKNSGILEKSLQGLPSWREVISPHPDVAQGRYKKAEFAADLAQVAHGKGALEYRDPVEFFARTYVTEGMKGLLVQGLKRVNGKDGEPVIQLKTAFGGGKTHSMLALYHMMKGNISIEKVPALKPVLAQAGVSALPRANVAVLVGTALNPAAVKQPPNLPGVTVNTLWGEMAAQLAISSGKPEVYSYVKEADKKGVAPGSEALINLFDACAPCLILMDELVAYAKTLYGTSGLPAGNFDNFITFIQQITEAARASQNSMVVASIPESDIEIGGEAGKRALDAIEHTFGRMESIWKPVDANEGFEVVRRRLFLDCTKPELRDKVCNAFSNMYVNNSSDFPIEAKEVEYLERMRSCYPIHPEVFERLYEDWATLEKFQRTRGVLRLMAAVVHELWMGNDASAMIMPGSIQLDVSNVRDELTRYLGENWNAIVDNEVDGKNSVPFQKDKSISRYGQKLAARRVARTIMLGSAPSSRSQTVRGIETSRIRLGVVQPGENIADFNDALNALRDSLAYLYSNPSNDRYWYDTRPTLRKMMQDRSTQQSPEAVEDEIERRLKKLRVESPFAGLHTCPSSSLDVPDEKTVRLVLLRPKNCYSNSVALQNNSALIAAEDILNNRGSSPRINKNMLAFVAPDRDSLTSLQQAVRQYLAWYSIKEESESLNLDAAQNKETENNLKQSSNTVDMRILETYCWLLVPYIDRENDIKTINWNKTQIRGGNESIVAKAARKMLDNEDLIVEWAPSLLLMELDNLLWQDNDNIEIKKLWEQLCAYCYLPRLADYSVLEKSIKQGVNSKEYFALAAGKSNERFLELKYNQNVEHIETSALLVKIISALKQITEEQSNVVLNQQSTSNSNAQRESSSVPTDTGIEQTGIDTPQTDTPKNTRFFMSAKLDTTRINRDVNKLVEEIISHLTTVDGCNIEVSLEVNADAPKGMPSAIVRTVSENCRTLKVDGGFEE